MWHKEINHKGIKIYPTIMGCGHMQIHGLSYTFSYSSNYNKFKEEFENILLPQILCMTNHDNRPM